MRDDLPPDEDTPLNRWPWVEVRFRCHYCARRDDFRLAALAAKKGHRVTLRTLISLWSQQCPWHHANPSRKPQKYGHKCGGHCPDLGTRTPPDLPPSAGGLVVIEGGKDEMLPASPVKRERRRRVGGDNE